jgi:hypothetical protein
MNLIEIINIFKKYSFNGLNEQEDNNAPSSEPSAPSNSGGSKYPTVTKWDSGVKRGKSNTLL